jgi:hypothetical protein
VNSSSTSSDPDPFDRVVALLQDARPTSKGVRARCPAHDDSDPSLDVDRGDDGRVLVCCRAGCSAESVVAAIGLTMADLFANRRASIYCNEIVYRVCDYEGLEVAQHHRINQSDGVKKMWWSREGKTGLGGVKVRDLPLYGTELLRGAPTARIVITEGEKACEALRRRNLADLLALATVTGAGGKTAKAPSSEVLRVLKDRDVVLWPDDDDVGRQHMILVGRQLRGVARSIRTITWKGPEPKCDAADFTGTDTEILAVIDAGVENASQPSTPPDSIKPTLLCPGEHAGERVGDDVFVAGVLKHLPAGVLYRRGNVVGELVGPRGAMRFEEVDEHRARAIIDQHMQIERLVWNEKTEAFEPKYLPCSRDLAALFLATAARTTTLRELRGIVSYPVFLGDELVLAQPGWNEGGIYYDEPIELEDLQPRADGALACFDDLTTDFPFRCDASRENSYGLMLTPLLAPAIRGNIPNHLVLAPLERTGKGLLIDVELGIVILGEDAAPVMQLGNTEEEREKRITAAILEGATVTHFDNLPAEQILDSPSVASLATSCIWRGRILGRSQIIRLPNTLIPIFSGNNPKATGELTKRSVPIALQPKDEHPEERDDFKHPDIRGYARQRRRAVLEALLGIVIAWRDAGRPASPHMIRMGGFEEWVRVVGGVLALAGASTWMTNFSSWIRAGDEFAADAAVLVEHWLKVHGAAEVTAANILAMARQLEVFPRVFVGVETGTAIRLARQVLNPLESRPVGGRLVKRRAHGNASRYWLAEVTQ